MLMEMRKVEEALELAKVAMQTGLGSSRDKQVNVVYYRVLDTTDQNFRTQ